MKVVFINSNLCGQFCLMPFRNRNEREREFVFISISPIRKSQTSLYDLYGKHTKILTRKYKVEET